MTSKIILTVSIWGLLPVYLLTTNTEKGILLAGELPPLPSFQKEVDQLDNRLDELDDGDCEENLIGLGFLAVAFLFLAHWHFLHFVLLLRCNP